MVEISTSILEIDEKHTIEKLYDLETAHTDYFHIDVMDGKFVEKNNIDKMIEYASYIKQISNLPLDVHLMVEDIKENIIEFIGLQPNIITFHIEATKNKEEVLDLINYIKNNNCKVGISIKPDTDILNIYEYLNYIHLVLIMTVEPGKGGQKIIPNTIQKIKQLQEYKQKNNIDIDIEVDGGINLETVEIVKKEGANIIVAGTGIVKSDNYKKTIEQLKK